VHPDGLALRFGIERDRFASVALLATKKAYGRAAKSELDAAFHGAMRRLIETHSEMLFLIRPHPAHGEDGLFDLQYENVLILDETCCIAADISINRIIPLVDQVIAPISTVALDGAVSDRPVIVYDGAQPQTYDHLEAVPVEQLSELVGRSEVLSKSRYQARLFRAAYAEALDARFYEHFAGLLAEPVASGGKPDVALATAVSLAAEVEQQWLEAQQARTEAAKLWAKLEAESVAARRQAEVLVREAATARNEAELPMKEAATLRRDLELAQRRIKRMRRSVSWRITKPLRRLARVMRHLTLQRATH
jgi:CDP-glycerol glycerophosphotransferase (TagB/SpsB family)